MTLDVAATAVSIQQGRMLDDETARGILVQRAPGDASRGRQSDLLLAVIEFDGQVEQHDRLDIPLLRTISEHYYRSSGSITAALRAAIGKVNDTILRANMESVGTDLHASIFCAVLREDELFSAHVGRLSLVVGHSYGLEWLPQQISPDFDLLGMTAGPDMRFFHKWLQNGENLLIGLVPEEWRTDQRLRNALSSQHLGAASRMLAEMAGSGEFRGILAQCTDELQLAPAATPFWKKPQAAARGVVTTPAAPESGVTAADDEIDAEAALVSEERTFSDTVRRAAGRSALAVSSASASLARFFASRSSSASSQRVQRWHWPTILALIVPVLLTLTVTAVFIQNERSRQLHDKKDQIAQFLNLAGEPGRTEGERREFLDNALEVASAAQKIAEDDAGILRLRESTLAAIDRLDGVERLEAELIFDFPIGMLPGDLAIDSQRASVIYLLNRADGSVHRLEVPEGENEQAQIGRVISQGQQLGSFTVRKPVDLEWRPASPTSPLASLSILDSSGAILLYEPQLGTVSSYLLPGAGLRSPTLHSYYRDRLYVLDSTGNLIWRLQQGEGEFVQGGLQRHVEFDVEPDLTTVSDLLIDDEDGSLILSGAGGIVSRYSSGALVWKSTPVVGGEVGEPVPEARLRLVGRGLTATLYLTAPGQSAFQQYGLTGRLLHTYKAWIPGTEMELLSDARAMAIAEQTLDMYVATDKALYRIRLQ